MKDTSKKETTYDNYSFWNAYAKVRSGEWTEEDFHLWAVTVWNDGANTVTEQRGQH